MKNRKLEMELTGAQVKFLRIFAEKHYDGAKDNEATPSPIHVVQTRKDYYVNISNEDYYEECFLDEEGHDWDTVEEIVEDFYSDWHTPLNEIGVPFVHYKDCVGKKIVGANGEVWAIENKLEYLKAYGVTWEIKHCARIENYENVAFFFILDEAKDYMQYQSHNLRKPRVYTYDPGYNNAGDFEYLRDVLMSMGTKLLEEDKVKTL